LVVTRVVAGWLLGCFVITICVCNQGSYKDNFVVARAFISGY